MFTGTTSLFENKFVKHIKIIEKLLNKDLTSLYHRIQHLLCQVAKSLSLSWCYLFGNFSLPRVQIPYWVLATQLEHQGTLTVLCRSVFLYTSVFQRDLQENVLHLVVF